MNYEKAYNYRQVRLMEKKIILFKNKKIELKDLINDLEALLTCIKNPPKNLRSKFINWWSNLESVYANATYENRTFFDQHDLQIINEAIKNLEQIIETYKNGTFTKDEILKFDHINQ